MIKYLTYFAVMLALAGLVDMVLGLGLTAPRMSIGVGIITFIIGYTKGWK